MLEPRYNLGQQNVIAYQSQDENQIYHYLTNIPLTISYYIPQYGKAGYQTHEHDVGLRSYTLLCLGSPMEAIQTIKQHLIEHGHESILPHILLVERTVQDNDKTITVEVNLRLTKPLNKEIEEKWQPLIIEALHHHNFNTHSKFVSFDPTHADIYNGHKQLYNLSLWQGRQRPLSEVNVKLM